MPIDFDTAAVQLRLQLRLLEPISHRLGRWLERRRRAAEGLEARTRAIPAFGFRDGALQAYIDRSQHGALGAGLEPPTLGQWLRRTGRAFGEGVAGTWRAAQAERVLPGAVGALDAAAAAVAAAMARFRTPTPGAFELARRRGADLFGIAGLAFRAAQTSGPDLAALAAILQPLARAPEPPRPEGRGAAPAPDAAGLGPGVVEGLDVLAHTILGGVLLLPLLPSLLAGALETVIGAVESVLVQTFRRFEGLAHAFRRKALQLVAVRLPERVGRAMRSLAATEGLLADHVGFLVHFCRELANQLGGALARVSHTLRHFLEELPTIFGSLFLWLEWLAGQDRLGRAISDSAMVRAGLEAVGLSLSPADLLPPRREAKRAELLELIGDLDGLLGKLSPLGALLLSRRIELAREIVRRLFAETATLAETSWPDRSALRLPDVAGELLAGGTELSAALAQARAGAAAGVLGMVADGQRVLERAARASSSAAGRAAWLGAVGGQARRMGAWADAVSQQLFGGEVARLRERARPDPLAQAFEASMAGGGIALAGRTVERYLEAFHASWLERSGEPVEVELPADRLSAHKLAARARLGRVRVRAARVPLVIPIGEEGTAGEVAAAFEEELRAAYETGRAKLARLAAGG